MINFFTSEVNEAETDNGRIYIKNGYNYFCNREQDEEFLFPRNARIGDSFSINGLAKGKFKIYTNGSDLHYGERKLNLSIMRRVINRIKRLPDASEPLIFSNYIKSTENVDLIFITCVRNNIFAVLSALGEFEGE